MNLSDLDSIVKNLDAELLRLERTILESIAINAKRIGLVTICYPVRVGLPNLYYRECDDQIETFGIREKKFLAPIVELEKLYEQYLNRPLLGLTWNIKNGWDATSKESLKRLD